MSHIRQKSSTVFPDLERIADPEIKQVFSDLFKVLQGAHEDSFDDANQSARWEVDGTETQLVTADEVDMQSKKIINVTDPASAQDASTKTYTDTKISKTTAAEISAMTEKTSLADGDHFLIEDSAAANAKKRVQKSNIASDKISKTTAGEIAAMTEKTTLVDADLFLIEDSAASNAKKKVQRSNVVPGVFGRLISTTTHAGTTNTGDIAIAASKRYLVTMVIAAATGTEPDVSIRFNSSATPTGYAWNGTGSTFATTAVTTTDGDDSDSEISLAKSVASGGYVDRLATLGDGGFIRGYFYIDTNKISTTHSAFVTGSFLAQAYAGYPTRAEFAGFNKENLTITDFELVFSTNCSFTINLYELD